MTIKEMQKIYKKIYKMECKVMASVVAIRDMQEIDYSVFAAFAAEIVRGNKALEKIANAMGRQTEEICGFKNVDEFAKWCFINNIEMHENESASNDDESEEE